jgi:drug/metabolite transporter (DMT)-like permease
MADSKSIIAAHRGYIYVILAAAFWAASGTIIKHLFSTGITPFQMVQLRVTLSTVTLFLWLRIRHPELLKISPKDILYFILLGTLGYTAVNVFYILAISKLQVAVAILIEYMAPVLILLYLLIFMREKPNRAVVAAMASALLGCYLVVGGYNINLIGLQAEGIAYAFGAAFGFAWWSVHGEYGMHRYNPWTVLFYASIVAMIWWNIIHPPLAALRQTYSATTWMWILLMATVGTILPFGLYFEGVNLIRATRASIIATLEPIMAGALALIFLNEMPEPLQVAGGILIIAAVVLLQFKQETDEKAPQTLRAKIKR